LLICLDTDNQFKGLIELITLLIFISLGGLEFSYCVFPGNKKEGYCKEKEKILTSSPLSLYALAKELLKFEMPPLYG